MINRIRKAIRRAVKKTALAFKKAGLEWRKLRTAYMRAPKKKRIALAGATFGIAGAAVALAVILLVSGAKNRDEEVSALSSLNGTTVLEGADVKNGDAASVISIDITPSPTPTPTPTPQPTPTPTPDPTLRRGMECAEVEVLQRRLMELGYLDLDEPTQKYGPATESAVERFQRQVNFTESLGVTLDADGVAGIRTQDILFGSDAPKYCVIFGMEGDDITDMQEQLKDLGYMKAVTGYYGETTVAALKDFQDRNGLSADGLCGEKTFSLLYSDSARESATKAKEARTKANVDTMISVAKSQLGDPYVLGAKGPSKFDCSGLVYYCLHEAGSNRRRLSAAGYSAVSDWEKITSIYDLKKGDLIFFYSDDFSKIGHVGIVINNSGEMIDASSSNGKVVRRDYITNYWKKHFYCGRRPW